MANNILVVAGVSLAEKGLNLNITLTGGRGSISEDIPLFRLPGYVTQEYVMSVFGRIKPKQFKYLETNHQTPL